MRTFKIHSELSLNLFNHLINQQSISRMAHPPLKILCLSASLVEFLHALASSRWSNSRQLPSAITTLFETKVGIFQYCHTIASIAQLSTRYQVFWIDNCSTARIVKISKVTISPKSISFYFNTENQITASNKIDVFIVRFQ